MKNSLMILVSALSLLASGCASINSVSLTPIPSTRSQVVKAEASKTFFLFFTFDNDFIDPIVDDLKRQCPNGVVSGILTKDEVIGYVLVFTRKVTATGYCSTKVARNDGRRRVPSSEADPLEN